MSEVNGMGTATATPPGEPSSRAQPRFSLIWKALVLLTILLGVFPAAILVPVALNSDMASSYVYGPVRFILVALGSSLCGFFPLNVALLVVALVLLLACTTVGTLFYARTAIREGEMAMRSALGASRARIISQLFVEALVSKRSLDFVGNGAKSTDLIEGTLLIDNSRGGTRWWSDTFCGVCTPETRDNDIIVAIRGGGHNGPGLGTVDDGLVIDLSSVHHDPAALTLVMVAATGWLCGRFTWTEVVHTPNSTARRLAGSRRTSTSDSRRMRSRMARYSRPKSSISFGGGEGSSVRASSTISVGASRTRPSSWITRSESTPVGQCRNPASSKSKNRTPSGRSRLFPWLSM